MVLLILLRILKSRVIMIDVVNEYNKKWALKQILQKCTIVVFHYGHMCLYFCSDYNSGFIKEFWMDCSKWTIIEPHAKAAEYTCRVHD